MCYIGVTEGKLENLKKMAMILSVFICIYTIHLAYLKVYTKFENTGSNTTEKSVTEIFIGEKKNEQIMGLISNMWLFFVILYHLSLFSFEPNFRVLVK